MQVLRAYRTWEEEPSYRKMAGRAEPKISFSALHAALKSDRLPPQSLVAAIVAEWGDVGACSGCPGPRIRPPMGNSADDWSRPPAAVPYTCPG
jgi:hypothetical protein